MLERAGLKVWYDATHLGAGAKIASELGQAIGQCRSALVVISRASVDSGWVEDEWNLASVERNRRASRDFRLIPLRIEDCQVPRFLEFTKWVDLPVRLRAGADGVDANPELAADLVEALEEFLERCRARPRTGHAFLAADFDDTSRSRNQLLRRVIQRCSGLYCVVGEQVGGDSVHSSIIRLIRDAVWVLADVSGNNLNTCIEAGAACGAGVDCTLVARKPYQQQPFMLRGMELKTYDDAVDLLAIAHRAARAYRRKVLRAGDSATGVSLLGQVFSRPIQ